jgi:hypothetical protein
MKKLFVTLLCSVLFIGVRPINSFAETKEEQREPSIYVNDVLFKFENLKPIVRNDRVLIPLKSGFFQTIGLEATYDIINKEITIKSKNCLISSYLQELDWYNFGIRCYINDVRSDYLNNDVYIPLRAITESVGLDMNYNDENYSISIKC